jgi:hypothetical protein
MRYAACKYARLIGMHRAFGDLDDGKDNDNGGADSWRFTPSLLDSNNFNFGNFGSQGYYIPTPGGMNTIYHNQTAGDLHTPGMSFQLGTPLSMSLAEPSLNIGAFDPNGFHPQMFQNQSFQTPNIFQQQQQQQQQHDPESQQQQQTYHPSMLVHQDSGYGAMDGSPDNDADRNAGSDFDAPASSKAVHYDQLHTTGPMAPLGEKYGYLPPSQWPC